MLLSSIILKRDKALSNSCLMLSNNMKWLYKSWESKICGCAELMIHPYWVHLDKICLRSVKHLISKEIFSHQASQNLSFTFPVTSLFIGKIELFDVYHSCKRIVLDGWNGAKKSPYSKLCETSRHCLMFTQTLSSLANNVLVPGLCQQEEVYYVRYQNRIESYSNVYRTMYRCIPLLKLFYYYLSYSVVIWPFGSDVPGLPIDWE